MTHRASHRMRRCAHLMAIIALGSVSACAPRSRSTPARGAGDTPPAELLGTFTDDYKGQHVVSDTVWQEGTRYRYRIVAWHVRERWLVAENAATNPRGGGNWTRIDWVPLEGMPPYRWAYCQSAYNAPTRAAAESTHVADQANPRTGCNRNPFTRMARAPH